jgi:hypothetical protein
VRARSRAISVSAALAALILAHPGAPLIAQATGTIAGTLRAGSTVVTEARVLLDTVRETRSDSGGRFIFSDVPFGRHTVRVLSIGTSPFQIDVLIDRRDTIAFELVLEKIALLDSVVVQGSTVRQGFVREFEDRRRVGMGRYVDSAQIKPFAKVAQALSFVTGVRSRGDTVLFSNSLGGMCRPNVWIDKMQYGNDPGAISMLRPDDVMAVEVYQRATLIPMEFRPGKRDGGCGALVIWTRRFWPTGKDDKKH